MMKYTKPIVTLMILNVLLIFSTIFIANKTREIEKNNNSLKYEITKINKNLKINKIELTMHKNSFYLDKIYSLYFSHNKKNTSPKIITLKQFSDEKQSIKLVNINK